MSRGSVIRQASLREPGRAVAPASQPARRRFLLSFASLGAAWRLGFASPAGDDRLRILQPDDLERLKLDFNTNRDKVRLLFVLSPT